MPRNSTERAAHDWLAFEGLLGHPLKQDLIDRLAVALEDHARSWAKELNLAWDRRTSRDEHDPGVPVLQPQFDELLAKLTEYRRAVEHGGAGTPPGLLEIAVAELGKRLVALEAERCELCGARFSEQHVEEGSEWTEGPNPRCHPCVENERLRNQVEAHERDFKDAAGSLVVELPEPGTVQAKLVSANVLMRRQIADLLAGADRGDRLVAAEDLLRDLKEVATTADEERQGQILRRWDIEGGAFTSHGVIMALLEELVVEDGTVETVPPEPEEGR